MTNFVASKVVIIDSLEKNEFQTGREIEIYARHEFRENSLPLPIERHSVQWAGEFNQLIKKLTDEAKYDIPLIHVEMHGDEHDGLIFANGSSQTWEQVGEILAPLNRATNFNLACVFSACYGAYFTKAIQLNYASPCFAMVAPEREVDPGDIYRAFRNLYRNLAKTRDLGKAAGLLSTQTPIDGGWFHRSADVWFLEVLSGYVEDFCSRRETIERATRLRQQILIEGQLAPSQSDMEMIIQLQNYEYVSSLIFDRFFMIDALPENRKRFESLKHYISEKLLPKLRL